MNAKTADIAIFIPSFGDGGVERMLVNLSAGFVAQGFTVDFLVKDRSGPYIPLLPDAVRIVETGTTRSKAVEAFLCRYLSESPPRVLMSAKKCDREAIRAVERTGAQTRVYLRVGTTVSRRDQDRPLKRFLSFMRMRRLYPRAAGLIAVSEGVAADVEKITGIPRAAVRVIRNPVITPALLAFADEPLEHPWFAPGTAPVILGAGGLRHQKDFPTLLEAFAKVRETIDARLMILGSGRLENDLLKLAQALGIADDFALPGFIANPYPFMRQAALFVLSSAWEGSPNVLAEALALGTPVVSTDCPSGPREILKGGEYGELVDVGDVDGLAAAMLKTLREPLPKATLRSAVDEYTQAQSARRYLEVFGLVH